MVSYTIEQLQARDQKAWQEAAEEIRESILYAFESETNGNKITEEDLEEIANDCAKEVLARVAQFQSIHQLHRYARKAARSRLLDRVRKVLAQKRGEGRVIATNAFHDLNEGDNSPDDPLVMAKFNADAWDWSCFRSSDPARMAAANGLRRCLHSAMEKLDTKSRQLLDYAFFKECTNDEVAEKMKVSVSSVGNRINQAVAKLRKALGMKLLKELKSAYLA